MSLCFAAAADVALVEQPQRLVADAPASCRRSGASSGNRGDVEERPVGHRRARVHQHVVRRHQRRMVGELAEEADAARGRGSARTAPRRRTRRRTSPFARSRTMADMVGRFIRAAASGAARGCRTVFQRRCTQYHCSGWRTTRRSSAGVVGARVAGGSPRSCSRLDRRQRRLEAQHVAAVGLAPARRRQHRRAGRQRDDREALEGPRRRGRRSRPRCRRAAGVLVERKHDRRRRAPGARASRRASRAWEARRSPRLLEAARDQAVEPLGLDRAAHEVEPAAHLREAGDAGDASRPPSCRSGR